MTFGRVGVAQRAERNTASGKGSDVNKIFFQDQDHRSLDQDHIQDQNDKKCAQGALIKAKTRLKHGTVSPLRNLSAESLV